MAAGRARARRSAPNGHCLQSISGAHRLAERGVDRDDRIRLPDHQALDQREKGDVDPIVRIADRIELVGVVNQATAVMPLGEHPDQQRVEIGLQWTTVGFSGISRR